jgi:uncharacterized membrane protein YdjX (TVP38/TMEM64 family)
MRRVFGANRQVWLRAAAIAGLAAFAAVAGWLGWPALGGLTPDEFAAWFAPYRRAWYAPPLVMAGFVVLGLAMVPVLLLITATGVAFGPVLGPLYAMAGSLASASVGFAIGRWTGIGHIERVGGTRALRIVHALERNGTLAVFLLRKIPAPFLVANIVAGASRVRYRDFVVGTLLGMTAAIVALAGFGSQLTHVISHPSPRTVFGAVMFVSIPLSMAWFINRMLRQPRQTI